MQIMLLQSVREEECRLGCVGSHTQLSGHDCCAPLLSDTACRVRVQAEVCSLPSSSRTITSSRLHSHAACRAYSYFAPPFCAKTAFAACECQVFSGQASRAARLALRLCFVCTSVSARGKLNPLKDSTSAAHLGHLTENDEAHVCPQGAPRLMQRCA